MRPASIFRTLTTQLVAIALIGCGWGHNNATTTTSGTSPSTTTLTSSVSTVVVDITFTLTATVAPAAATGYVTYYDGATALGSTQLNAGTSTLLTSLGTTGTHNITATYGGDGFYDSSTSNAVTITVTPAQGTSGYPCGYQDPVNAAYTTAVDSYSDGKTTTLTSPIITAGGTDKSAICADYTGTILNLSSPTITSTSNTGYQIDSNAYGMNAAVLAYGPSPYSNSGATINLTGGTISTSGTYATGVYASGMGALANVTGTTINTSGDGSRGLFCSENATLTISNVTASTTGASASSVGTDLNSCAITLNGGTYTTSGTKSAALYSTGTITATGGAFTANNAPAAVIDGNNSITTTNSTLLSAGGDGRAVQLFSSTGSIAVNNTATFSMTGGSLIYSCPVLTCALLSTAAGQNNPATMFNVTNATAKISLNGVTINNNVATFLTAGAMSYGTAGANGGLATVSTTGTAISGNILVDSISTASLLLSSNSSLTGAINTAKTGFVASLSLDGSSTWNVTNTSYVTSISDPDIISGSIVANIIGHGFTVYYSNANNPTLGGLTYALSGGGSLKPY